MGFCRRKKTKINTPTATTKIPPSQTNSVGIALPPWPASLSPAVLTKPVVHPVLKVITTGTALNVGSEALCVFDAFTG